MLAGDKLLCLVLGKRIQTNIIISCSTISSSTIVPWGIFSTTSTSFIYICVCLYNLIKSGIYSPSPSTFWQFIVAWELPQLPAGGSASRTPVGFPQKGWEPSKKVRIYRPISGKRWNMIGNDKPTTRDETS